MWSLSSSEQQRLTLEQLQQHSELQYLQELQILQQYQQQQQQQQLEQSKDLLQQQLQHTLLYGDQLQLYAGQYGSSNSSSSSSSSGLQSAAAAAAAATHSQHQALKDHNQLLSQYNNYLANPLLQWQASQDAVAAAAAVTHDQTSELTHSIPHVQSHNIYDIPGAASHASSSRKSYDVSSAKETLKKHIPLAFENILQDDQDGLSVSSSRSTPLSPLLPPLPSPVLLPPVSSLLPSPLFSPQLLLHPPQPLLASSQQPERPNSKPPPPLVSSKSDTLNEFRLWNSYLSSSDIKTTKETSKSINDYKEKNVQNENVSSKNSSYSVPERKDTTVHKVSAENTTSTYNNTSEAMNLKLSIPSKKADQSNHGKKNIDNPIKGDTVKAPPQQSRLKVRSLGSLLAVEVKEEKNETKNGSIYSFESSKNNDSSTLSKINMGSFLSIESVDSDDNDTVPGLKIDSVFSIGSQSQRSEINDSIFSLEGLSELSVHISNIQNVPNNSIAKLKIRSSSSLELSKNNESVLADKNEISISNLNDSRVDRDALLHMNGVYHVLQNKSSDNVKSAQSSQDAHSSYVHTDLSGTNIKGSFQMVSIKKEVEEIQESSIAVNVSNINEASPFENLHDKNKVESSKSNITQPKIKEEPKDTYMVEDKLDHITEKSDLVPDVLKLPSDLSRKNRESEINKESIVANLPSSSNNEVEQILDVNIQDRLKKYSNKIVLQAESDLLNESGDYMKDSVSNLLLENKQLFECSKNDSLVNGFVLHMSKESNDQVISTNEKVENITIQNACAKTGNQNQNDLTEHFTTQNLVENNITQNKSTRNNFTQNKSTQNNARQNESTENKATQNELTDDKFQNELTETQKETQNNIIQKESTENSTTQIESAENLTQIESEENYMIQRESIKNVKIQNVSTEMIKMQNEQTEIIRTRNEQTENIKTQTILTKTICEPEKDIDKLLGKNENLQTKNESKKKIIKLTDQSSMDNTSLKSPFLYGNSKRLRVISQSVQEDVKTENQNLDLISESTEDKKNTIDIIPQNAEVVSSVMKKEKKSKLNSLSSKFKKKEQKHLPVKMEIIEEHLELADPIYDSDAKMPACPKSKKMKKFNKTIKKESKISLSWNGKIKAEIKPDNVFEFSEETDIKSENVFEFTEENEWIPEIYHKVHDGDAKIKETDVINLEINVCDICGLKLKSLKGLLIHRKRHFRLPAADVSLQHSLPAIDLHSSLYPPFLGQKDYRLYHHPKLKNLQKQVSIGVWTVSTISKKNKKESNHINTVAALSGLNGGQCIMLEYSEEFPTLLSQVGMCSRIKNYWQPISEEDKVPIGLSHGEYVPVGPHFSPFLAAIRKGKILQAVENNMYRAPIYSHKMLNTDFLIIGSSAGYSIRELDGLYTVGQQSPLYEVPQPNSRPSLIFNRNFLKMFVYRLFKRSGDKRRIEMKDIKTAFPSAPETFLRKILKPCSKFHRTGPNSNYWVLKPEFALPSDLEINKLIKPEEYCANYSSSTASYRLQQAGYKTQFFSALENGDEEDCEAMEDEIKAAPWNTTRSYITALKGVPCLELTGNADPTGCGEGFSYVFMSQHRRRTKAKQLQRTLRKMQHGFKKTDFRKLPLKKAIKILRRNGVSKEKIKNCERWGVIAMVKKLYEKYNKADYLKITELYKESYQEECQRIFDLQNNSLSSDKFITTDDESEQDETEDINDNKRLQLEEIKKTEKIDSKCHVKSESDNNHDAIKLSDMTEDDKTLKVSSKPCNMEVTDCTKKIFKNAIELAVNKDNLSDELMDNITTDHEIEDNEIFDYNGDYLNLKVLRVPLKRLTDSDITHNFCENYNISNKSSQRLKRQLSCDDLSSKRFASESSLSSFSDVSNEALQNSPLNDKSMQTDVRDDMCFSPFSDNSREPIIKDCLQLIDKLPFPADRNISELTGSLQKTDHESQKSSIQRLKDNLTTGAAKEQFPLSGEDPYDFDANEEHMSDVPPLKVKPSIFKREIVNHQSLPPQGGKTDQSLPPQGGKTDQSLPPQGGKTDQSLPPQGGKTDQSLPPQGGKTDQSLPPQGGKTDRSLPPQGGKTDRLSFQQMVERMEENDNMENKGISKVAGDNNKEIDKYKIRDSSHSEKITNSIGDDIIKQETKNNETEQSFKTQDCDILPITDQKQEENIYSKVNFIIGPYAKCSSKVNYMQGDVLRIVRTFQTTDGRKYLRTEIVRNPDVIKAYVNIRTTKDEEYIKNHISKLDEITKKKLHKERRRIQEQLRRIKRHEDKVRKGVVVTKEKKISKKNIVHSTCGACGQVGHMRTNKNCPLNNSKKEEIDAEESVEPNSSSDEGEPLVDLTYDSQELVKVEGTKIILSASVVKAAEKYKEYSPVTKHLTKRSNLQIDEQTNLIEKEQPTMIKEKLSYNNENGKQISKKGKNKHISKKDHDKDKKSLRRQKQPKRRMSRDYIQTQERGNKRCRTDPRVTLCTFLDSVFNDARNMPGIEDFLMPVYRRDYPDYYIVIKNPMDLSRVKEKINKHEYDSRKDFLEDISLIVNNSKEYNGNHSILTLAAHGLFVFCKEKLDSAEVQMVEVERDMTPRIIKKKRKWNRKSTVKPESEQDNSLISNVQDVVSVVVNDDCNSLNFNATEEGNQIDSQTHHAEGKIETESQSQQNISSFPNMDNPQIYFAVKENANNTLQNNESFEIKDDSSNNNANFSESFSNVSSETVPTELIADPVDIPNDLPGKVDEIQASELIADPVDIPNDLPGKVDEIQASELANIEFDDIRELHDAASDGPSYEDVDYLINNVIETTPNSTDELPEDATQILDLVNEASEIGNNHNSSDELNRAAPNILDLVEARTNSSMNPNEHQANILSDLISYLPNEPLNSSELMENAPNINADATSFQTNSQFPTNFSSDFILNQTNTLTDSTVYSTDYSVNLVQNSLNSTNEPTMCAANFNSSLTSKPKDSTNDLINNPIQGLTEMCDQVVEYTESDQVTNYTENSHNVSESGNLVTETQQLYTETDSAFIEDGQAFTQDSQVFSLKDSTEVEKDQGYAETGQTFAETSQSFPEDVLTFTQTDNEVSTKEQLFGETGQVYTDTPQVFQINQEFLETENVVTETGLAFTETAQAYEVAAQSFSEAVNEVAETPQDYQINNQTFSESDDNVEETEQTHVEAPQLLEDNNQTILEGNTNEVVSETGQAFVSTAQDFKEDDHMFSEAVNRIEETNQELAEASNTVLETAHSPTDESHIDKQTDHLCSKTNKEFTKELHSSETDQSYTDADLKESDYVGSNLDHAFTEQCEAFLEEGNSEEANKTSDESIGKAEFITEGRDQDLTVSAKSDAETNESLIEKNQSYIETDSTVVEMDKLITESEPELAGTKNDQLFSDGQACIETDQSVLHADYSAGEDCFAVSTAEEVDAVAETDQVFADVDQEFEIACPVEVGESEETNLGADSDAGQGCEVAETVYKATEDVLAVAAIHQSSDEEGQVLSDVCHPEGECMEAEEGHNIAEFEGAHAVADISMVLEDQSSYTNESDVKADVEQESMEINHIGTEDGNALNETVSETNCTFEGVETDKEFSEADQEFVGQSYTDNSNAIAVPGETFPGTDHDSEEREYGLDEANKEVAEVGETSIETSQSDVGGGCILDHSAHHLTETDETSQSDGGGGCILDHSAHHLTETDKTVTEGIQADVGVGCILDQSAHHLTETDETVTEAIQADDAHLEAESAEMSESSQMITETSQNTSEVYAAANNTISESEQLVNKVDCADDIRENSVVESGLDTTTYEANEELVHDIFEAAYKKEENGTVTDSGNYTGENDDGTEIISSFAETGHANLEASSLVTGEIQPLADPNHSDEKSCQSVLEAENKIEESTNADTCQPVTENGNENAELRYLVTENYDVITESNPPMEEETSQATSELEHKLEESMETPSEARDSLSEESCTAPNS